MASNNPLAEIFGFPSNNQTNKASHYRENRLCPFHNRFPNCTKDKADDPLGVCSIFHNNEAVITCPSRFREDWRILHDVATHLWPNEKHWTCIPEVRLLDAEGFSAGNIDYVIVKYNDQGSITDFASIEVQGVYISGNLRNPFQKFMNAPTTDFTWEGRYTPHPDYLSSSRKRLIPQIIYKGSIINAWNKKQCIIIQKSFFDTLPHLEQTTPEKADIIWLLYSLNYNENEKTFHIQLTKTIYTEFHSAITQVLQSKPGKVEDFVKTLQTKLDDQISNSPDTLSIKDIL